MNTYIDPRPVTCTVVWQHRRYLTHFPRAYRAAGFLFTKDTTWLPWYAYRLIDPQLVNV